MDHTLEYYILLLCSTVDQMKKLKGLGHQNELDLEIRMLILALQ